MAYSKKTTHVSEGLANLISQFQDKPNIAALLTVYLEQLQELECALSDTVTETTIETAVGEQLDNLGSIVGEPRGGRNDVQYRTAIRARIGLNTSEGTIEDVVALAIAVAGAPVNVTITELFPAGFLAAIQQPIDPALVDVDRMASFIASGRPAGVRGLLSFGVLGSFQYDGGGGTGFDEGPYGSVIEA